MVNIRQWKQISFALYSWFIFASPFHLVYISSCCIKGTRERFSSSFSYWWWPDDDVTQLQATLSTTSPSLCVSPSFLLLQICSIFPYTIDTNFFFCGLYVSRETLEEVVDPTSRKARLLVSLSSFDTFGISIKTRASTSLSIRAISGSGAAALVLAASVSSLSLIIALSAFERRRREIVSGRGREERHRFTSSSRVFYKRQFFFLVARITSSESSYSSSTVVALAKSHSRVQRCQARGKKTNTYQNFDRKGGAFSFFSTSLYI